MPDEEKKWYPSIHQDLMLRLISKKKRRISIVDTKSKKQMKQKQQEQEKSFENERETKLEEKKDDDKLEEYSKGVQARIAKLTRKMREAERREQAALNMQKL